MKQRPTYVFAGGGTGGHVFPAIAIAQEIQQRTNDARIVLVGSAEKIEARAAAQYKYEFEPIVVRGLQRKMTVRNFAIPFVTWKAVQRSRQLLKAYSPECVIGTGGYVSGPVLYAAKGRVRNIIHEQNVYPGLTTRMLSKSADAVCISFEETRSHLQGAKSISLTGNPIRSELQTLDALTARIKMGLPETGPVLLVFGGSLGARAINNAVKANIESVLEGGVNVLWQTGSKDYSTLAAELAGKRGVRIVEFIDDMSSAYASANLVVCRAGATTISELTALGKPSILVPYPYAAKDHQRMNAIAMERDGCALMIEEHSISESLTKTAMGLIHDPAALERMSQNAKAKGLPNAAASIVDIIERLVQRG